MKKFVKFLLTLLSLGFISALFIIGLIIYISFDLPQINSLNDYNPNISSRVYSRDGELLLEMGREKRKLIELKDIPQKVVDSFLAAEDDNFYNHSGVDYIGIIRAMLKNIQAGKIVQGASTITQQVAKSLLLTSERTFTRKIKDLLLAQKIEDRFTKDEILYLYLNQVYLGGGYYGVKAAFEGYFGKEIKDATVAQSALIAGLLVAPGKYSPYVNPKYAKRRQRYVLKRLYVTGKISKEEYEDALAEEIQLQLKKKTEMKAGYFTDWIRQRVMDELGVDNFLTNGFEITTTLDWKLQQQAEIEIKKGAKAIDRRQGFKGPIASWSEEEISAYSKSFRIETLKENSTFFTLKPDGSTVKEFEFDEQSFNEMIQKRNEKKEALTKYQKTLVELGNDESDQFVSQLEKDKLYKAVVTKVSNNMRLIFVTIGGVKAYIPEMYFKWAHKRNITDERNYWSYVRYPEQVVSVGDVIHVSIKKFSKSYWFDIFPEYRNKIRNEKVIQLIKEQKMLVAQLDQEVEAQAALVSISPISGEIISLVGGTDFDVSQFNRAIQSNRQPGSAFKPILYAVGLENGFTPASILLDSPQALGGADDSLSWKPRNYDNKFKGEITYRRSLETSRNIPTIRLTQDIGVDKIIDFVKRIGLDVDLPNDLSLSLGSFGINLLDLVKSYAIFPSGGRKIKIKSILSVKDRHGRVYHIENDDIVKAQEETSKKVQENESDALNKESEDAEQEEIEENQFLASLDENQVYDRRLAYIMTNLMKGVIENGTGRRARDISSFIGGKTGTTNNYVDAWFIGFSSRLVTGVWTGFDNNNTLGWGETGAKSALPIWKNYMEKGIQRYGEYDFPIPSGIVNVAINKKTGQPVESLDGDSIMESFVEGTAFKEEKEVNVENEEDIGTIKTDILDTEDYYNQ